MPASRRLGYLRKAPCPFVLAVAMSILLLSSKTIDGSVGILLLLDPNSAITSPPVILQNGTAGMSTIYTNNTSAKVNIAASQTLYAHRESTSVGGVTCRLLKLDSADSAGLALIYDAANLGRIPVGNWVHQLTGVQSIPASTWTFYYRANKTNSAVEAHCDVDIRIRRSNGTIRQTIATDVANSGPITLSYSTLPATYSWAEYTVVDETDYLEIDYYIEITAKRNNEHVNLRVDDSSLAKANQTRTENIYLPDTYDYVLRVNNTDTASWQIRLREYSSSNIGHLQNCTIYFHNATDGTASQIIIENGVFIDKTGPWYDLANSETIYVAMTTQANGTGTADIYAFLEVLVPETTTYSQYVIIFAIT
jgi:hypothetical protein